MVFYVVAAALPGKQEKDNDVLLKSVETINGRMAASVFPVRVYISNFESLTFCKGRKAALQDWLP